MADRRPPVVETSLSVETQPPTAAPHAPGRTIDANTTVHVGSNGDHRPLFRPLDDTTAVDPRTGHRPAGQAPLFERSVLGDGAGNGRSGNGSGPGGLGTGPAGATGYHNGNGSNGNGNGGNANGAGNGAAPPNGLGRATETSERGRPSPLQTTVHPVKPAAAPVDGRMLPPAGDRSQLFSDGVAGRRPGRPIAPPPQPGSLEPLPLGLLDLTDRRWFRTTVAGVATLAALLIGFVAFNWLRDDPATQTTAVNPAGPEADDGSIADTVPGGPAAEASGDGVGTSGSFTGSSTPTPTVRSSPVPSTATTSASSTATSVASSSSTSEATTSTTETSTSTSTSTTEATTTSTVSTTTTEPATTTTRRPTTTATTQPPSSSTTTQPATTTTVATTSSSESSTTSMESTTTTAEETTTTTESSTTSTDSTTSTTDDAGDG